MVVSVPEKSAYLWYDQRMAKKHKLTPGEQAPDGTAADADGREVSLSSFWAEGPVLLTFLRHFG